MKDSLNILKRDKLFAPLVKKYGPPDFGARRQKNAFQALLRAIVYQQISGKAASAILSRVIALFPSGKPTPEVLLKTPVAKLRKAGLSPQKIGYARGLARKCLDGTIQERKFPRMSSGEIIDHLIQVKGVGAWTAHMFLIFTLKRLDVLPTGDLGIRKGFQITYKLRALPDHARMEHLAKGWRAHASVASWYLWRVADEAKER